MPSVRDFSVYMGTSTRKAGAMIDEILKPEKDRLGVMVGEVARETLEVLMHCRANLQEVAPNAEEDEVFEIVAARVGRGSRMIRSIATAALALYRVGFKKVDDIARLVRDDPHKAGNLALALMPAWRLIPRIQKAGLLEKARRVEAEAHVRTLYGSVDTGPAANTSLMSWVLGWNVTKEEVRLIIEQVRLFEAGERKPLVGEEFRPKAPVVEEVKPVEAQEVKPKRARAKKAAAASSAVNVAAKMA